MKKIKKFVIYIKNCFHFSVIYVAIPFEANCDFTKQD